MEVTVFHQTTTGQVVFVDAPSEFVEVLKGVYACSNQVLSRILPLTSQNDKAPWAVFNRSLGDRGSQLLRKELDSRPALKAFVQRCTVRQCSQYLVCNAGGATSDKSVASSSGTCQLFLGPSCPVCIHVLRSAPCQPKPAMFVPSSDQQSSLDPSLPIYRCSAWCSTFSNACMALCGLCLEGRMCINTVIMHSSGEIEAAPGRSDSGRYQGPLVVLKRGQYSANVVVPEADLTKGLKLFDWASVYKTVPGDVDFSRPVYLCYWCSATFSNIPNAPCSKCDIRHCTSICNFVTSHPDDPSKPLWHPLLADSADLKPGHASTNPHRCLLSDNLSVLSGSASSVLQLLCASRISDLQDIKPVTLCLGLKDLAAISELGQVADCANVFTEVLKPRLSSLK